MRLNADAAVLYGTVSQMRCGYGVRTSQMRCGQLPPSPYAVRLTQAIGPVMRCGHNHGLMIHEPSGAVRSIYYQCGEMDAVRSHLQRKDAARSLTRYTYGYGQHKPIPDAVRWQKAPTLYFDPEGYPAR